jgi:hypothetical protein
LQLLQWCFLKYSANIFETILLF